MNLYDGSFEQQGRSPVIGIVVIFLISGGIYFLFQAISTSLVTFFSAYFYPQESLNELHGMFYYYLYAVLLFSQISFFVILPAALFRKWHSRAVLAVCGYGKFGILHLLPGIMLAIIIIPFVGVMAEFMQRLFPGFKEMEKFSLHFTKASNIFDLLIVLLTIGICPAVCEEFFFRAFLQKNLQRFMKFPWALILSSLAFALFHFNTMYLPVYIVIGLILGSLYWIFDSPYPSMIMHGVYNSSLVLLDNGYGPVQLLENPDGLFVPVITVVFTVLFVVAFFSLLFFSVKKAKKNAEKLST